jgi:hypothetical protein
MAADMTYRRIMAAMRSGGRQRGNIEERGGALRVRLYAGTDPVTHRQVYLRATIPGTDKAAHRKAEDKLSEFRTQVLKQRTAASSVSFSYAIDEWLRTSEIEASTRKTYLGYIANHIKPVLGGLPVKKLDVRTIESFYTELRRCRSRCDGQSHDCKPLSASTVQQIHSFAFVPRSAGARGAVADPVGDPGQQVGIGAGGAGVVFTPRSHAGSPQWPPVRSGDNLDVPTVVAVLAAPPQVQPGCGARCGDPVGVDQRAVHDDMRVASCFRCQQHPV